MMKIASSGARLAAALITALILVPPGVQAQNRGDRAQDRQQMEQRFRRQMARMIEERLGLDDGQSQTLSEVIRGFEGRRRELGRAEMAVRRRVEALMLEGGNDEAEAEVLLSRLIELRAEEARLFADEQAALLEVLSPVQVLQLQSLREEMGRRIRALRGRDGPAARRRGGNGDLGWAAGAPLGAAPDLDLLFPR
jgi:Spy/CpxP family protein refolding chaperone